MADQSYRQFCPVAMAAEVLCPRWTMVLLRELVAGSARFNELRRGVPRMSPTLLSKRLRELERAGIVTRSPAPEDSGHMAYELTEAGRDLAPVIEAFGTWGQKWIEAEPSLKNVDPGLLMWDMRRNLDPTPLPLRKTVFAFLYSDQPEGRRDWWLIVEPGKSVDLCSIDPGFDVDLFVETDLKCMTAIWMGLTTVRQALDQGKMSLEGDRGLADRMQVWLGRSPFARQKKLAGTG
ncbi:HxlR family transcriptional regulator [Roseovarius halotolerans]|uniref:Putative HTH-type transcriptional regulator YybR n=1 Tax=Roseovarius halotolerans TaxID=505353 RepID=A0A1X6ZT59_9RHOB|nr:helix-turn-helix domain-containing protein [Roseovarius halotolerans]RKT27845.1 HxlR family transcriptional regulator [Roseovarius halotolerans]SLN60691.1 putative HTH-type transcriptional regulator YybR [Roseovarius halotolerans]